MPNFKWCGHRNEKTSHIPQELGVLIFILTCKASESNPQVFLWSFWENPFFQFLWESNCRSSSGQSQKREGWGKPKQDTRTNVSDTFSSDFLTFLSLPPSSVLSSRSIKKFGYTLENSCTDVLSPSKWHTYTYKRAVSWWPSPRRKVKEQTEGQRAVWFSQSRRREKPLSKLTTGRWPPWRDAGMSREVSSQPVPRPWVGGGAGVLEKVSRSGLLGGSREAGRGRSNEGQIVGR